MAEDKKEISEAIAKATPIKKSDKFEKDIEQDTALSIATSSLPVVEGGLNMPGLGEFPKSDLFLPQIKCVQGMTEDTTTHDGKEAALGSFLHTADKKAYSEIIFSILRVKKIMTQYKGQEPKPNYMLMGVLDGQLGEDGIFIMRIPLTSISNFKSVVTQIHRQREKHPRVWTHKVRAWAEAKKRANEPGKYYQMQFQIIGQNEKTVIKVLDELFSTYAGALSRNSDTQENERL